MGLKKMGWSRYETAVGEIAHRLSSEYAPVEAIVGIARAGLPLATSLASALSVTDVGVLFMRRTISDEPFSSFLDEPALLGYGLPFRIEARRILLVDNVVHSGKTILSAVAFLESQGARNVVCAALAKYKSSYDVDVIAPVKLHEDEWVIWPWDWRRASVNGPASEEL
jgi:hypoxanthine phosphoribosyltransferase